MIKKIQFLYTKKQPKKYLPKKQPKVYFIYSKKKKKERKP